MLLAASQRVPLQRKQTAAVPGNGRAPIRLSQFHLLYRLAKHAMRTDTCGHTRTPSGQISTCKPHQNVDTQAGRQFAQCPMSSCTAGVRHRHSASMPAHHTPTGFQHHARQAADGTSLAVSSLHSAARQQAGQRPLVSGAVTCQVPGLLGGRQERRLDKHARQRAFSVGVQRIRHAADVHLAAVCQKGGAAVEEAGIAAAGGPGPQPAVHVRDGCREPAVAWWLRTR